MKRDLDVFAVIPNASTGGENGRLACFDVFGRDGEEESVAGLGSRGCGGAVGHGGRVQVKADGLSWTRNQNERERNVWVEREQMELLPG